MDIEYKIIEIEHVLEENINDHTKAHVSDYPYKDKKLTGLLIKGRKENGEEGNSMFLPAAGQFAIDFENGNYRYRR